MKALLLIACALAGCARPPACYRARSTGRGWRRVEVPRAAPKLAAPEGVEQYRSDEDVIAWTNWVRQEPTREIGRTRFSHTLLPDVTIVEMRLEAPLAGAAVEVIGERFLGSFTILPRTRIQGDRIVVEVETHTSSIELVVHNHLRHAPTVNWREGRRWRTEELISLPQFRRPASLYYFDPGAGAVELCDAPARVIGVRPWRIDGEPRDAAIAPTLSTRMLYR